ncbi:MAG: restriction endonuclease [Gammaproteobacteria bacterium]|nr:restriction endonuclease [Gammaproteobacteria bacterium]
MNSESLQKQLMIFRVDEDNEWIRNELDQGRLRQGWGDDGLSLVNSAGERIDKSNWENAAYKRWGENPSPRRFVILSKMLELTSGDFVIVPKMPEWNQFTIARVSGSYKFEVAEGQKDFGHIIPVDKESIRKFHYKANKQSFIVSALFSRANHRPAVSFCNSEEHVNVVSQLLEMYSEASEAQSNDLLAQVMDSAYREAAKTLASEVEKWNGPRFEDAVRQSFEEQGYQIKYCKRYDGEGSDIDMLVSPPANQYTSFVPAEIAVQVKWKQGIDQDESSAIDQISKWADWQCSEAKKIVISSASEFTKKAHEKASDKGVELICGLQTMCFLLGISGRYREEWDN